MRKIFSAMIIALMIVGVQNFCSAAEITEARFSNNDKLIYPVVHLADSDIEAKVNGKIFAEIQAFVKQMHYAAQYENRRVLGAYTNYEVGSNEAHGTIILSLIITKSIFYEGAAHPATYKHALNFNLSSGTRMGLSYLTDIGEGVPIDLLIDKLSKKLREKTERENLYLFENKLPLERLPENFYWDENLHVHFIFQEYEIAPYAAGIIDVDIDG